MSSHHMLADALEAAAFLTALDLKQAGGPTDDLSATFTATANALAVLSFAPSLETDA